ncbi:MAG: biotin/lipoyl-binding protein, partial [Planctomycetes bacterium]|nr:biotin/lipoyl-binding protein [Planctomycetota bacterium]
MKMKIIAGKIRSINIRETVKLFALLGFLAGLMFWLAGAFREKVDPGPGIQPVPAEGVKTFAVELRRYPLHMDQVGTIKTENEARISSRLMAQVVEVTVREGEEVKGPGREGTESTLLARLDDRDIQARLRQALSRLSPLDKAVDAAKARSGAVSAEREAAEANRVQAESNFRRYRELYDHKAATGQQLENAEAQWKVAETNVHAAAQAEVAAQAEISGLDAQKQEVEAAVAEARVMLSHTLIRAPFSGRVARKYVEAGDTVAPGQALFLLDTPAL